MRLFTGSQALATVLFLVVGVSARASSLLPLSTDQEIELADAICRGTVTAVQSYRSPKDGMIYTRTRVRVDESLKGKLPTVIHLVHRGGMVPGEIELNGFSPQFKLGEQRLLLLTRQADGTWFAMRGGASVVLPESAHGHLLRHRVQRRFPHATISGTTETDQVVTFMESGGESSLAPTSVTGMLVDTNGISSRYIVCDKGDPIPYLIDTEALPAGITLAQATNAVRNAFQAWTNITSLKFKFEGLQNFGAAANNIPATDGKIRIQLHDLYGAVPGSTTLGIGGQAASYSPVFFPLGGLGGRVGANEFHLTMRGFAILKHTQAALQNLSTFEETICHEIGHALSLAHSSENPSEPDSLLKQAMMYYTSHADGRGAALGAYDPPVVRQAYPQTNTPPYGYDRVMRCVTSSSSLANPQVNQVEVGGYDLQTDTLARTLHYATSNGGTFALNGSVLTYSPSAAWDDSEELDPADPLYFFDSVYIRFDDGTNASAPAFLRVIQFLIDTKPNAQPDGLPDSWMTTHFGSATPVTGLSRPIDDPDGDGQTNLGEFQAGTNPRDGNSAIRVTVFDGNTLQWSPRPYDLYELQSSTNLTTWARFGGPIFPTTNTASVSGLANPGMTNQFFRIRRVP